MQEGRYATTQAEALVVPIMLPPLTIEMLANTLSKIGEKNEASLHNLDALILNFSKLTLLQIYTIQHTIAMEIRIREATTTSQEAEATRKVRAWKELINH